MRVHLFAAYHTLSGVRNFDLAVKADDTIRTAVYSIIQQFPVLEPHWLDKNGNLQAHLTIILNKVDAASLTDGLDTRLKCDDELDFLPPVGGGC
jgi:molybdopterin converting factor small subunit